MRFPQANTHRASNGPGRSVQVRLTVLRGCSGLMIWAGVVIAGFFPAQAAAPYLRLRESQLGYHGTDADLAELKEFRIGWFGPTNLDDRLTGDIWWAANLAVSEANAGTVAAERDPAAARPFRLVPRWAVDPWGTGVSQLTRMVFEEQPLAIIGSVDSSTTHLAEQVVAKANLPLISPIATDKSLTLAGVSWMFSCAPGDDAIARVLVADVLRSTGAGQEIRVALLNCTDHESRMTARELVREFSLRGRMPALRLEVPPNSTATTPQISALQRVELDAVVIIGGVEDAARWVCAVREKLSCTIYGSHSMGRFQFRELAGKAAEKVRFPLLFLRDPKDEAATRFLERFVRERRRSPDYTAAFAYDATRLLIEAVQRAGPNRTRIREELARCPNFSGVAGNIQFDGTGQNIRSNILMATIRDGIIVPLTTDSTEKHNVYNTASK